MTDKQDQEIQQQQITLGSSSLDMDAPPAIPDQYSNDYKSPKFQDQDQVFGQANEKNNISIINQDSQPPAKAGQQDEAADQRKDQLENQHQNEANQIIAKNKENLNQKDTMVHGQTKTQLNSLEDTEEKKINFNKKQESDSSSDSSSSLSNQSINSFKNENEDVDQRTVKSHNNQIVKEKQSQQLIKEKGQEDLNSNRIQDDQNLHKDHQPLVFNNDKQNTRPNKIDVVSQQSQKNIFYAKQNSNQNSQKELTFDNSSKDNAVTLKNGQNKRYNPNNQEQMAFMENNHVKSQEFKPTPQKQSFFMMPEDWQPGKPFRVPDPTDPTGRAFIEIPAEALEIVAEVKQSYDGPLPKDNMNIAAAIDEPESPKNQFSMNMLTDELEPIIKPGKKGKKKKKKKLQQSQDNLVKEEEKLKQQLSSIELQNSDGTVGRNSQFTNTGIASTQANEATQGSQQSMFTPLTPEVEAKKLKQPPKTSGIIMNEPEEINPAGIEPPLKNNIQQESKNEKQDQKEDIQTENKNAATSQSTITKQQKQTKLKNLMNMNINDDYEDIGDDTVQDCDKTIGTIVDKTPLDTSLVKDEVLDTNMDIDQKDAKIEQSQLKLINQDSSVEMHKEIENKESEQKQLIEKEKEDIDGQVVPDMTTDGTEADNKINNLERQPSIIKVPNLQRLKDPLGLETFNEKEAKKEIKKELKIQEKEKDLQDEIKDTEKLFQKEQKQKKYDKRYRLIQRLNSVVCFVAATLSISDVMVKFQYYLTTRFSSSEIKDIYQAFLFIRPICIIGLIFYQICIGFKEVYSVRHRFNNLFKQVKNPSKIEPLKELKSDNNKKSDKERKNDSLYEGGKDDEYYDSEEDEDNTPDPYNTKTAGQPQVKPQQQQQQSINQGRIPINQMYGQPARQSGPQPLLSQIPPPQYPQQARLQQLQAQQRMQQLRQQQQWRQMYEEDQYRMGYGGPPPGMYQRNYGPPPGHHMGGYPPNHYNQMRHPADPVPLRRHPADPLPDRHPADPIRQQPGRQQPQRRNDQDDRRDIKQHDNKIKNQKFPIMDSYGKKTPPFVNYQRENVRDSYEKPRRAQEERRSYEKSKRSQEERRSYEKSVKSKNSDNNQRSVSSSNRQVNNIELEDEIQDDEKSQNDINHNTSNSNLDLIPQNEENQNIKAKTPNNKKTQYTIQKKISTKVTKQQCQMFVEIVIKYILLIPISFGGFMRMLNNKTKFQNQIIFSHCFELFAQNIPLLLIQVTNNSESEEDYYYQSLQNASVVLSVLGGLLLLIELIFYQLLNKEGGYSIINKKLVGLKVNQHDSDYEPDLSSDDSVTKQKPIEEELYPDQNTTQEQLNQHVEKKQIDILKKLSSDTNDIFILFLISAIFCAGAYYSGVYMYEPIGCGLNQVEISDIICESCIEGLSNCAKCTEFDLCDECDKEYFLGSLDVNGTEELLCLLCTEKHGPMCDSCTNTECLECKATAATGEVTSLFEGICYDCSAYENSKSCDDKGATECQPGFFLETDEEDGQEKCTKCAKYLNHCLECSSAETCTKCSETIFDIFDGKCDCKLENAIYDIRSELCECPENHYSLTTGCKKCEDAVINCEAEYCSIYEQEDEITTSVQFATSDLEPIEQYLYCQEDRCEPHDTFREDNGGKCTYCSEIYPNCEYCRDGETCIGCYEGYYQDTDDITCKACSDAIAHCTKCYKSSSCQQCEYGYSFKWDIWILNWDYTACY